MYNSSEIKGVLFSIKITYRVPTSSDYISGITSVKIINISILSMDLKHIHPTSVNSKYHYVPVLSCTSFKSII